MVLSNDGAIKFRKCLNMRLHTENADCGGNVTTLQFTLDCYSPKFMFNFFISTLHCLF